MKHAHLRLSLVRMFWSVAKQTPMRDEHVKARVSAFITHMWSGEARKEREAKERVRVQTRRCMRTIQCEQDGGTTHVYGFVCDAWQDTVAVLRGTGVPSLLLFGPDVHTWEGVDEGMVARLSERVATDVVLRMRLLDASALGDVEARDGQARVTAYLATNTWPPQPQLCSAPAPRGETGHGEVEQAFVTWAMGVKEPQRSSLLPHLFVWLHVFLARSAHTHTFHPLFHAVRWGEGEALALAEDLLAPHLYSRLHPHLATMGLRVPCLPQDLARHLPPTTCGAYTIFQDAVHTTATGGTRPGRAFQTRSRSPPGRPPPKGWTRMTARSLLYPPMYLGPRGQLSFNLSE